MILCSDGPSRARTSIRCLPVTSLATIEFRSGARRELILPFVLLAISVAVPVCREELYPFSRMALFTDSGTVYCEYIVRDPAGNLLPLIDFSSATPVLGPSRLLLPIP